MNEKQKKGTALITGASSGMGYEYACILAGRGFDVVLVSNEEEKLKQMGDEFGRFKVNTATLYIDLALPEAALEVYEFCRQKNIQVDILINNAGFFFFGEVVNTAPEKAIKLMTLHMITTSMLCQYFGKEMKERRYGYILNMSSMSAGMAYPGIAYYSSTKRYIRSFSRALRTEMKDYNVSVTAVCPGAVATNLFDRNVVDYKKAMRYGMMMKADKVAGIVLRAMFRRKAIVTPGFMAKLITFLTAITPHGIILFIKRNTKFIPAEK